MFFDFNDFYMMDLDQRKESNDEILFLKGNMFENEYKPYKNYTYIKPKIKNEKERLLYQIMMEAFKVNDYNLYLDLNPDDQNYLTKLKESAKSLEEKEKEYEKKYGPLMVFETNANTFDWIKSPWPWEGDDSKYV